MPANLFNFSKYFKKKDITGKSSQTSGEDKQSVSFTTTTQTSQTAGAAPYSGIGKPSGGGVSYSGIGKPPKATGQHQTVVRVKTVSKGADIKKDSDKKKPSMTVSPQKSSIDMQKRVGMDVLSRLTQRSSTALMNAVNKAKELKLHFIDTEHVLWGLLQDSSVYQIISECKVVPSEIQTELKKRFKRESYDRQPQFSPRVKRVLELSLSAARSLGYEFISPEHILLALSHEGEGVAAQVLNKHGLKTEVLNQKITGKKKIKDEKGREEKGKSTLDKYTEDLTSKAAKGELDPVVRRSWEIERIVHILSRRTKNNPVLIGDAGVGKTAIVEGLAIRIAQGDVPETLLHKRILSLDLMSLIAGARHRGEFEERLKNLIKEVKVSSGSIILFIDELHNMVGAGSGSEGTMDASNILKPSLARGELQAIGATTIAEFRKHIEKDPALARRFQPVLVVEPSPENAIEMLRALRDKYEAFHRVKISDEAIAAAVKLSQRYIGDRFLPDKAVDLIDEASAAVRLPAISLPEEIKIAQDKLKRFETEKQEAEKMGDKTHLDSATKEIQDLEEKLKELTEQYKEKKSTTTNAVTPSIIADIVSRWTNIPVSRLTASESAKLLDLEAIIHKRLINQNVAVVAVSEAVRRGRAGLKSTKRPIGSFIFLGPTGVGKTELAKTLAETLFGSEEMMVRLDMTEYMEKHEVAKLIGAPPGYVGYEEGGQLTEAVRRRPYSVVLFDEIEKAHPDVFNILIQLLDDGRLTDNKGHTISFKNTIVICTSNIGTGLIQRWMVEGDGEKKEPLGDVADKQRMRQKGKKKDVFKTFTVSPTGREIITLRDKLWEKEVDAIEWKTKSLADYFAGSQIIEEGDKNNQIDKSQVKTGQEFPKDGIDTHVIAPDGSETVTKEDKVWFRTSTTSKEWVLRLMLVQVKGHTVINALPDKPEQQIPTAGISTHAISPRNVEIITVNGRYWKRDNLQTKDWITGSLSNYLKDCYVIKTQNAILKTQNLDEKNIEEGQNKGESDNKQENQDLMNVQKQMNKGEIGSDEVKDEQDEQNDNIKREEEPKDNLQDLKDFSGKTRELQAEDAVNQEKHNEQDKEENEPQDVSAEVKLESGSEVEDEEELQLPTENWDIHTFKPTGEEILVRGDRYWLRADVQDRVWTTGLVKELFAVKTVSGEEVQELPLGGELEEDKYGEDEIFAELASKLMDELQNFFRPELLNRYDEVVVFRPLKREHMVDIVNLQINGLSKLLAEQDFSIEITDIARNYIAEVGYDPIFGARPLRRTIQRLIENPVSSMIIKQELEAGDTVLVDYDGEMLVFNVKKPKKGVGRAKEEKKTDDIAPGAALKKFRCLNCGNEWHMTAEEGDKVKCPKCTSKEFENITKLQTSDEEKKNDQVILKKIKSVECQACHYKWQITLKNGEKAICPKCESDDVKQEQKSVKEAGEAADREEKDEQELVAETKQPIGKETVQQPSQNQMEKTTQSEEKPLKQQPDMKKHESEPKSPSPLGQYFEEDGKIDQEAKSESGISSQAHIQQAPIQSPSDGSQMKPEAVK